MFEQTYQTERILWLNFIDVYFQIASFFVLNSNTANIPFKKNTDSSFQDEEIQNFKFSFLKFNF